MNEIAVDLDEYLLVGAQGPLVFEIIRTAAILHFLKFEAKVSKNAAYLGSDCDWHKNVDIRISPQYWSRIE